MSADTKESKAAGIGKKISGALWWCVVIILILVLINVLGAKMRGEVPNIAGYSILKIVSGSMGDEMPVGTYVLVKKTSPDKVKEGDVICFYSTDPRIYGFPNTHRVVEPPIKKADGTYEFVTKGDNNPEPDKYNAEGDKLVGVYVKKLDALTSFAKMLEGRTMIIIIVILQLAIFTMLGYSLFKLKKSPTDTEGENADEVEPDSDE